ncbi:MAG: reverse transcriptase/maturase family protein [Candidatus Moranbacteria bacterium]|nr:reverse transcriptase/maturase family protein [Candidatus Moranbacteria bacterium]
MRLMDNIFLLHSELLNHTYKHGGYQAFKINDPKPRDIHKATVRDRLLHHAIYRKLYPFFDRIFIADSYSCRNNKGTHKAINRFRQFAHIVSKNNTKTCWILKCDIRKFFANIDHKVLVSILKEYISDENIVWLLENVIESFTLPHPLLRNEKDINSIGLPLGNLTSQLFVNIYMNKFDQFVKHKLKVKYYIRYADDFVIFSKDRTWLEKQIEIISKFLKDELKLELHPDKVYIKTLNSGVDFLGWVNFSDHRVLRTKTKKRMIKRIRENPAPETINSYFFGLLKHGNTNKIKTDILKKTPF